MVAAAATPMTEMTTGQVLEHLGITDATQRTAIIEDLMPAPDGIANLGDETIDDVKHACIAYAKRTNNPFIVPRVIVKRITGLVLWVKDQTRLDLKAFIADTSTADDILLAITVAQERDRLRIEQKKIGESVLTRDFQTKLKSQGQWNKWKIELNAALNSIIGANGIPLIYVIREEEVVAPDPTWTYEEMARSISPVEGVRYIQDARTVHQVILGNIHEDSDAYAYIKPNLKKEDGRLDMKALRGRYENLATQQAMVGMAQSTLENLRYRNEKSFSFEKFSARMQSALDDLEFCGRPENDANIVDRLWGKIQAPEIQGFLAALKVDHVRNPRNYKDILQDVAAEIASNTKPAGTSFSRNVSSTESGEKYCQDGTSPSTGAYTASGKLFIGSYAPHRWNSPEVRPHHDEIRKAREENGHVPNKSRGQKRRAKAVHRQRSQISKMRAQISQLSTAYDKLSKSVESNEDGPEPVSTTVSASTTNATDAGTAFGGKASMKKKGGKQG